uniref:Uncharacterized protein n=1 Tax=Acrobeloides nanus TaxID=290746 RepID=A0A914DSS5_9BILA
MNASTFIAIIFGVLFVISISIVGYQRNEISKLQNELGAKNRTKRSTDSLAQPDKYYFPLYTQLSDTDIKHLCSSKKTEISMETEIRLLPDEANRTKLKNDKYTKT